jgi:hypothetical protein
MSNSASQAGSTGSEDAALAQAGGPHGSTEAREEAVREEVAREAPTPEELDAREEHFTGPRKPMGPTEDVDETTPEER